MVFKDISEGGLQLLKILIAILIPLQLALLHLSYWLFFLYFFLMPQRKRQRKIVIGVTEAARLISSLGKVFQNSYTCVLDGNKFYQDCHDFGPTPLLLRPFVGPILLAYLSHLCDTFFYISFTGFLASRKHDLRFLRGRGKKIVMLFYGSDIRSLKKTKEFFDGIQEDSFVNYLPNLQSKAYDDFVRQTAELADHYADLIFNWSIDQIGYLTKPTIPWPYIIELTKFSYSFQMPANGELIKVLHCPSHNIVKGTPLVRAAVKKLREEGYHFEYIELSGVANSVVLEQLAKCHIVLQEFYCLTPGILGIEALAFGNAVLMSACHSLNHELPDDCDKAWLPTRSWQIYDNLKLLLDNISLIESYARNGREFIEKYYNLNSVREFYHRALSDRAIPF